MRIIEAVSAAQAAISMSEIERSTGLARPTVHRVTSDLIDLGYIERDALQRGHVEGPKLIGVALDVLRSNGSREKRRSILAGIAKETGETCHFALLRGAEVLLVDQATSSAPLGVRYDRDGTLPAHCTATGKLLLALLSDEHREATLSTRALTRHTDRTVTDRRRLIAGLAEIKASGVGTEEGEHAAGIVGIAVPVRLKSGVHLGAVGL